MLDKCKARQCINGLTQYALERQADTVKHVRPDVPLKQKWRAESTRKLIQGMAEFYALEEGTEMLLNALEDSLQKIRGCPAVRVAAITQQREVVSGLSQYARDMGEKPSDTRKQMLLILFYLEDIAAYLPWDAKRIGAYAARNQLEYALPELTAKRNISFTRILLGSECGPADSDFAGGCVTTGSGVAGIQLFADLSAQHPDITEWPAVCTVYRGGYGCGKATEAADLDLEIMRLRGDSFVKLEGIIACSGLFEFSVKAGNKH